MDFYTKEKRAEYMKRYREEHKEELYLKRKRWAMENQEHIDKYNKEYAEAHKEEIKAYSKAYYHSHKDEPEFKDKRRIARNNWMKNNRDKHNAYCRGYQRKRKALEGQI